MILLPTCSCCGDILHGRHDRRGFLRMAGGAAAAAAFPFAAFAQDSEKDKSYDAMLLACIDPRTQEPVRAYMNKQGLIGKYSQFTIAGAAIGAVAPKFEAWHQAFWDNLATSFQLHKINRIIVIDHRDCGAARVAYGDDSIATPEVETKTHRGVFAAFRRAADRHAPQLAVETGLLALDGTIQWMN